MNTNQIILIFGAIAIAFATYLILKKWKIKPEAKKWMRVLLICVIAGPLIADFIGQEKYKYLFFLIPGFAALIYAVIKNDRFKSQ